jgi:nicotinamide mononucleotide adenylyltransferase
MGGLGGHMDHIYDNQNLTFDEVMDILNAAVEGDLDVEEKVDGQNLLISYSLEKKSTVAARNLSNIRQGGLDAHGMAEKFVGHAAEKVFLEGFSAFEAAIESLPERNIVEIFGQDAEIWYNSELMDPDNPNIISYDSKIIKIHDTGHLKMEKGSRNPEPYDASQNLAVFDSFLESMKKELEGKSDFGLARRAAISLQRMDDDSAFKKARENIDLALSDVGLSTGATILQYTRKRLEAGIVTDSISDDLKDKLIQRILREPGYLHLNVIKKGLNSDQKQELSSLMKQHRMFLKEAIEPIEIAIHNFAVDFLTNISSVFVIDNSGEAKRIRNQLLNAVQAMRENTGPDGLTEDALSVMNRELKKLGHEDRINTAIEGVSFEYNGHVYKFTGSFAPVNQIIGMYYRTGTNNKVNQAKTQVENFKKLIDNVILEAMREAPISSRYSSISQNTNTVGTRTALFPGKFKPPHRGHFDFVNKVARRSDVDKVQILISPLEQDPVTARESLEIWKLYLENGEPNIEVEISKFSSPVRAVYEYIVDPTVNSEGDSVLLIKSSKDEGDTRFDGAQSYAARKNPGVNVVHIVEDPVQSSTGVVYSARDMRTALLNGDLKLFKSYLPPNIDSDMVWNIINPPSEAGMVQTEMSVMAAGGIEGHSNSSFGSKAKSYNPWKKKARKKPKVIRSKRQRRR